ncbi:MAG TPA: hypothetical protein PK095_08985 [Myxococcota bacterium]|nr:hypothetical protein [Myxococcota bacterium]
MRTPMNPIALFAATGLLGLVACDSDSSSSSTVAPSQIHEALAGLQCDLLTSCPQEGDSAVFATLIAASNKTACQALLNRAFEWTGTDIEAQVQSGALSYDGDKLASCFAQVRQSCDFDFLSVCEDAFEGKVAVGGSCGSDLDCAGDANCTFSSDVECGGTCKARVARGEACDFDGDCSQSAGPTACSFESSTCVPVTRELDREVGQRCDDIDDGTSYVYRTCKAGLACVDMGDEATCETPLAVGADCGESPLPCATGSFCLGVDGVATCQTLTITRTVGATCNHDPEAGAVVLCSVVDQLGCDNGKCKKWGDGTAGAYCSNDFETDFSCDRGLYCDGSQCQTLKAAGAVCESSSECASRWCDFEGATGTCAPETACE